MSFGGDDNKRWRGKIWSFGFRKFRKKRYEEECGMEDFLKMRSVVGLYKKKEYGQCGMMEVR